MVPRKQESRRARAAARWARRPGSLSVRRASSSPFWKRCRSCAAALIVKVTAERRSTVARPVATRATMRSTRQLVFPVPAAASTSIVVSRSSRIAARCTSSGRLAGLEDSAALFFMDLPKGGKNRRCRRLELPEGVLARRLSSAADFLEVAVSAVLIGHGVRKHARGDQVEEPAEDFAGRGGCKIDRDPQTFSLSAGKEVSGLRNTPGPAGP